ncbi:hypothetical protein ASG31_16700 [Chryseobacterium sp. Leaf404]|uniref:hypothetical protein n=1 Tax=unclassified Chryseobacterium TaxID=2593645 RepID=UPI0006FD8E34|nr:MULTISPECIES: hypothetical protein [unclassified Chryseobacterium]KQT20825.1 hypothetical protein ASG31_16700 [Chryseobacterium sp. Leaf404]
MAILLVVNEQEKKAFDFAADTVKQLITLATGIIALTITFSKDILGPIFTVIFAAISMRNTDSEDNNTEIEVLKKTEYKLIQPEKTEKVKLSK